MESIDRARQQLEFFKQVHMLFNSGIALRLCMTLSEESSQLELFNRVRQKLETKSTTEETFPALEEATHSYTLDGVSHVGVCCAPFNGVVASVAQGIKDLVLKLAKVVITNCLHKNPFLFQLRYLYTPRPDQTAHYVICPLLTEDSIELSLLVGDRRELLESPKHDSHQLSLLCGQNAKVSQT